MIKKEEMLSLEMESLLNPQSSHGTTDEKLVKLQDYDDNNVSDCSSTISSINGEDEEEEVNCSGSSGPLHNMSSLLLLLPSKRGLSKHYNGKSQSFTSLSAVACLEDLAKPDNPYKRLKTCKSLPPTNKSCSGLIAKKISNYNNSNKGSGFFSVGGGRRIINSGFLGAHRPPPVPQPRGATSSFASQTPLFA